MSAKCEYEGERNEAGEKEGRGTLRYPDGGVYEGEYKAGLKEGRGTHRMADGDVYEGEYKAGQMEGRGTFRWANGNVYEGEFKANMFEGRATYRLNDGNVEVGMYTESDDELPHVREGARWSADGKTACRLQDGNPVEAISLEEARRIAADVGEPAPF